MSTMKIAVRPLKGESFEVEVEPTDKVEVLKTKIAAAKPEFTADSQKLIYSGRILTNDTTIADVGIKAGEFVVVMVAKAKAPAAPEAPAAAPAPAAPAPAAAPASDGPMSIDQASANMVGGGGAMEGTISQLMEMGFEREMVERCLRAAFNNPDRAVEYLMSGIPPGIENAAAGGGGGAAPPGGGTAAPPPQQPSGGGGGGGTPFPAVGGGGGGGATPFPSMAGAGGGGGGGGAPLSASAQAALQELRSNPRFPEFAAMIAQNPEMLAQIIPVLAQQQPGLVQLISENPEAFRQALQEAVQGGGGGGVAPNDPVAAMLAAAQGAGGGGGAPPGAHVVRLTEDERAAVERLTALGFDRQQALQAYLACDKQEELAANFLFDAPMED